MTGQYAGLRTLDSDHDDLVVLGFPCNQFGAQEPGTDEEILAFVRDKYGEPFQLFSKIEVNGPGAAPLYELLKGALPQEGGAGDILWNFTKFLVGRDGTPLKRFEPQVEPSAIEAVLPDYA
jgi:glutathione peroxidase